MRPPASSLDAPALDVIASPSQQQQRQLSSQEPARLPSPAGAHDPSSRSDSATPNPPAPAAMAAEESRDSRSSSSTNSPVPGADNEESDFFMVANDSESSLGVTPNMQDMAVTDPECLPTVASLPSEILISIFSRLSETKHLLTAMLVCKNWARNVVEILWHRPSCTTWSKHASICKTLGMTATSTFAYGDFIKRINLAALADQVSDGSIAPLAVCPRVERMTLTSCKNLTDSGLIPLVRNSQHLLAMDISGDINITEATITAVAETCRRLQGLNISGCKQISNESLVLLAEKCRYIKRLKLNDCEQVSDAAVMAFAIGCPNILEIDLHHCSNIGNEPVTALFAKGNCLRELRLANCDLVDDSAFLSLPPNKTYEHLRILDLTSCTRLTDRAVERIIDVAPRLRNLVLAKCSQITDAAVNAIARLGRNLHYVHLGHCRNITDDAVKRLVASCNRIRYIDLGCCVHLTDESVTRLAQLPKLKRIGLVKCANITDESMYALARANHRTRTHRDATGQVVKHEYGTSSLERVHLSYCVNLTLPSIIKLLNCCPKLTHLSLTGVTAFLREDLDVYCRDAPNDFTEHQRSVFCVFSGQGVSGLRKYFNTGSEFAEFHEPRAHGRHNRPVIVQQALGPTEPDNFEEGVGMEDDDMLEASELGIDPGNHNDGAVPPPPPPPPPQPSAPAAALEQLNVYPGPTPIEPLFASDATPVLPARSLPIFPDPSGTTAQGLEEHATAEHDAATPLASHGAGPAAMSIFGPNDRLSGPSTASLRGGQHGDGHTSM